MFIHASGSSFLILVFGFRIRIGKKYMYKRRNILGFQICTLTMFFQKELTRIGMKICTIDTLPEIIHINT